MKKIVPTTIDMEYLKKYHKDLQLISEKVDSIKEIPDAWKDILSGAKPAVRVEKCLAMWEKHVASELSNTIKYLRENLEEWGILEELKEPLGINLKNTFGLFSSGAGEYVALDVSDKDHVQAVLWFAAKQPKYHIAFWDVVDEWIVIGMGQE